MKRQGWIVIVAAVGLIGMAQPAWAAAEALDGKTFSGQIGPQGKSEGKEDSFVFQDGAFESTLCTTFGYGTGAYTTELAGKALEFTAETADQKGGTMKWKGVVKGDIIEGTAVATENGQTSESWFRGTLTQSQNQ